MKRLMFGDLEVGRIVSEPFGAGHSCEAAFRLSPSGQAFVDFFRFMVDESDTGDDFPFPKEYLSSHVWWIDDDGTKVPIDVPAVHLDGCAGANTNEPWVLWRPID